MIKFKLLNNQIDFTNNQTDYNDLKNSFLLISNIYEKDLAELYETFTCYDDILIYTNNFFEKFFDELNNHSISLFVKNGVNKIDKASFLKQCKDINCFTSWNETYENLKIIKKELIEARDNNNVNRSVRRETRIKSGVFGTLGIFTGSSAVWFLGEVADIGINVASNVIHGSTNVIASGLEKRKINNTLQDYLEDPNTLVSFINCIRIVTLAVLNCYVDIFNNEKKCIIYKYPSIETIEEVASINNNVKDGFIEKESVLTELLRGLMLNPYSTSTYKLLYNLYGDPSDELQVIADYFKKPLQNIKVESIYEQYIKDLEIDSTEEYINNLKEKYLKICAELKIDNNNKILNDITLKLNKLDEEYRSVEGLMFNTRGEADKARLEKIRVEMIFKDKKFTSVKNVNEVEQEYLINKIIHVDDWDKKTLRRFAQIRLKLEAQEKITSGYNKIIKGFKKFKS